MKVCYLLTNNQALIYLFLTVSWDLHTLCSTHDISLKFQIQCLMGEVSAEKAIQGSQMRELLGETMVNNFLPN